MSAYPILSSGNPSAHSIYETKTAPVHEFGTRAYLPDGRVFYYTKNTTGSALTVGKLYVRSTLVANHQTLATATAAMAVGATVVEDVTLGATAATADQYKNGFLSVTSNGGVGHTYKIKGHAAIASAGTGDITLYDPIAVASDASTTVGLSANPYLDPQISVVDQIDIPVGVPTVTIAIGSTTPQYGWLQTWGECSLLADEAITTVGQAVTIGSSTAGSIEEDDTATTVSQEFIVGYTIAPAIDGSYNAIELRIRP